MKKGGKDMPNLKHLLEELEELDVQPKDIKINPHEYAAHIADAEIVADENE